MDKTYTSERRNVGTKHFVFIFLWGKEHTKDKGHENTILFNFSRPLVNYEVLSIK